MSEEGLQNETTETLKAQKFVNWMELNRLMEAQPGCQTRGNQEAEKRSKNAPQNGSLAGNPAPPFILPSANGKNVSLSDFVGRYIVLEWVNFSCPFVRKHYGSGHMQKLQNQIKKDGGIWLSICSSAVGKQGHYGTKDLPEILAKNNWSGSAYLYDTNGRVGKSYGAITTPTVYLISPEGAVIYSGALDNRASSTDPGTIEGAENFLLKALNDSKNQKKLKRLQPHNKGVPSNTSCNFNERSLPGSNGHYSAITRNLEANRLRSLRKS